MSLQRTVVYSTVFPGVEPFLRDWYESLLAQQDRSFDLWIGADHVSRDAMQSAVDQPVKAQIIEAEAFDTPASLRRKVLEQIVDLYDVVIFIDSDDVAESSRVAHAKGNTDKASVSGCALTLIDESGKDLGVRLDVPERIDWLSVLPWRNVLGMSNTAYGTTLLRSLLRFPDDCIAVDWFFATRAWLMGARIKFEHEPMMRYRQHPRSVTSVLRPFTANQVRQATALVLKHHECLSHETGIGTKQQWLEISAARRRTEAFAKAIVDDDILRRYLDALNRRSEMFLWWECVANPSLEIEWTT